MNVKRENEVKYNKKKDTITGCTLLNNLSKYRRKNINSKSISIKMDDLEIEGYCVESILKLQYNIKTNVESFNGNGIKWKNGCKRIY